MGSSVVLLGDQLPVPSQQGLRRDNAGDLGKSLSSQCFGLNGQSPALIVIQAHSPATELFSKHRILLAKIFNDLQLAVVHPRGDGDQQKSEWVEHSLRIQSPLSRPPSRSSEISHLHADPVFGPYGDGREPTFLGLIWRPLRTGQAHHRRLYSHAEWVVSGKAVFLELPENHSARP